MPAASPRNETVIISGLSNEAFLQGHARAGRLGLSGGFTLIDKAICRAQRHLDPEEKWGAWSHAFLFQGQRPDGHHWVVESDLQVHRKHIQLGVQENRVSKYYDEKLYSTLAVLDFGLDEQQIRGVIKEALDLVAGHERYSLRELFGTLLALRHPELRGRDNLLSRRSSMYCSAFVQHLFRKIGLDLAPGINHKNTTPEDLARTSLPHVTYLLKREPERGKIEKIRKQIRSRLAQVKY